MERFKSATGKDLGALEAEKVARAAMESRTQTQVDGQKVCAWVDECVVAWVGLLGVCAGRDREMGRHNRLRASRLSPPTCLASSLNPTRCPQAELNTTLHEQVIMLRGQKELSEAEAEKSSKEVKKLIAKVRGCSWLQLGGSWCLPACVRTASVRYVHVSDHCS